jgi:hypothetical protein
MPAASTWSGSGSPTARDGGALRARNTGAGGPLWCARQPPRCRRLRLGNCTRAPGVAGRSRRVGALPRRCACPEGHRVAPVVERASGPAELGRGGRRRALILQRLDMNVTPPELDSVSARRRGDAPPSPAPRWRCSESASARAQLVEQRSVRPTHNPVTPAYALFWQAAALDGNPSLPGQPSVACCHRWETPRSQTSGIGSVQWSSPTSGGTPCVIPRRPSDWRWPLRWRARTTPRPGARAPGVFPRGGSPEQRATPSAARSAPGGRAELALAMITSCRRPGRANDAATRALETLRTALAPRARHAARVRPHWATCGLRSTWPTRPMPCLSRRAASSSASISSRSRGAFRRGEHEEPKARPLRGAACGRGRQARGSCPREVLPRARSRQRTAPGTGRRVASRVASSIERTMTSGPVVARYEIQG